MTARPLPVRPRSAAAGARALGAMVLAMVLASCSLLNTEDRSQEPATAKADPSIVASAPAGLEEFYSQEVVWEPCEGEFQCAKVTVPMDYGNPGGDKIQLAALRASSTGKKTGSLLVNPGGPGASGYDFVKDAAGTHFSQAVRDAYDLVGFDPRGVKRSAPVTCMTDAERDAAREVQYDLDSDAGIAEAREDAAELAEKCAAKTGEVLAHVDTASAAKDMDIIRAVVGDAKLNYLGFSYGTFLGATYADLFPERVGRMVLDGAMDPSLTNEQVTLGQAKAFEGAIRSYAESCLASAECPLSGTVDQAVGQIQDLIQSVEANPLTAEDGRLVTVSTFVSGFIVPLYNDVNWPLLTRALDGAFDGDPTDMLYLADLGAERQADGNYTSNSTAAFTAINCLDYPMESDLAGMKENAAELEEASPTLGRYLAYGGTTCENWPAEPVRTPAPVDAAGADPILVIGTTGDPATPYEWAVSMTDQLESASLLTYEAQGHTAYSRGDSCVQDAVDSYFIEGTMPDEGTVC